MEFFVYERAKIHINLLIDSWSKEIDNTKNRRNERKLDIDIDSFRSKGKIASDETFIPERVIDTNIKREQPAYINFLKQSSRLVIMKDRRDPLYDTQKLELAVSDGLKYQGWLTDFYRTLDGAQTHGWDSLEITFDVSKPLHVAFEHVGHDKFFFSFDVPNPQFSERVARSYSVTIMQLEQWVGSFGFDPNQVKIIKDKRNSPEQRAIPFDIYKLYFKYNNVVYFAWYDKDNSTSAWLKAPIKLQLGISVQRAPVVDETNLMQGGMVPAAQPSWVPEDIDMYPIFTFTYQEDEEQKTTAKVGRCFLDGFRQEATTAILTSFVNGLARASQTYGSPEMGEESETSLRQLDVVIAPNKLYSKKINFWSPPYPDALVLSALNYLSVSNAQQTQSPDYAAMNRKDSRKTAQEMGMAQEESNQLKTIPMSLYSEHIRSIVDFSWKIIKSQALQDKIALTGALITDPMTGRLTYINDKECIDREYDVKPAGDVDYVQRQQKVAQMKQDWPVIQTTGAATKFLADLIRLEYPDSGDLYAKLIEAGDPNKAMVAQLATVLQASIHPDDLAGMTPQDKNNLGALQQQVSQMTGQTFNFMGTQNESTPNVQGSGGAQAS